MTDQRPDPDVVRHLVFDEEGHLLPDLKARLRTTVALPGRVGDAVKLTCDRKGHTVAVAMRTTFGWWVAWRRPYTSHKGPGWDYDWVDRVTGYTEMMCNCRRARRLDDILSRLR